MIVLLRTQAASNHRQSYYNENRNLSVLVALFCERLLSWFAGYELPVSTPNIPAIRSAFRSGFTTAAIETTKVARKRCDVWRNRTSIGVQSSSRLARAQFTLPSVTPALAPRNERTAFQNDYQSLVHRERQMSLPHAVLLDPGLTSGGSHQ